MCIEHITLRVLAVAVGVAVYVGVGVCEILKCVLGYTFYAKSLPFYEKFT